MSDTHFICIISSEPQAKSIAHKITKTLMLSCLGRVYFSMNLSDDILLAATNPFVVDV